MQYVYIASMTGSAGKSLVTLGLGLLFKEAGYRVGYIKPFGKIPLKYKAQFIDADVEFMRRALDIDDSPATVSPFVVSPEIQNNLLKGRRSDRINIVNNALSKIKNKDVVLVGGAAGLFEGSPFGLNDLRIISHLKAKTLLIEPWKGDSSIDSIIGAKDLLGKNFNGAVINRIPATAHNYIKKSVRPFLEKRGVAVYAALHRDILLDSITVRQLNEILSGKILCCEDALDEFIEQYSIGAMDVDSALKYFRRTHNKAVITGAHRADIQLAALETSTKCIILTGDVYTNEMIIGKAEMKGVPIISVTDDTFTTVERIEAILGKIRIREQKKVMKSKEIVAQGFDFKRLLRDLKL